MKKKIIVIILISSLIVIFILFCSIGSYFEHQFYDEFGKIRTLPSSNQLKIDSLLINDNSYKKYKDKLIGDGGDTGIVNRELLSNKVSSDMKVNEVGYLLIFGYGECSNPAKMSTFFKASLKTNDGNLFLDDETVDSSSMNEECYNYTIHRFSYYDEFDLPSAKMNLTIDLSTNSQNQLIMKSEDEGIIMFAYIFSFRPLRQGRLDFELKIKNEETLINYEKHLKSIIESKNNDIVSLDNLKVNFIDENDYLKGSNVGISRNIVFNENEVKYINIEFDIKVLKDNSGLEKIYLYAFFPYSTKMIPKIEESPTSDIDEEKDGYYYKIVNRFKIPSSMNESKHYQIVIRTYLPNSNHNDLCIYLFDMNSLDKNCFGKTFMFNEYCQIN